MMGCQRVQFLVIRVVSPIEPGFHCLTNADHHVGWGCADEARQRRSWQRRKIGLGTKSNNRLQTAPAASPPPHPGEYVYEGSIKYIDRWNGKRGTGGRAGGGGGGGGGGACILLVKLQLGSDSGVSISPHVQYSCAHGRCTLEKSFETLGRTCAECCPSSVTNISRDKRARG